MSRPSFLHRLKRFRQRGDTLISMLLASGVAAGGAAIAFQHMAAERERLEAEQAAVFVTQVADAVRRMIALSASNPAVLPPAGQVGVDWLRPPVCGGRAANPPQGFLPCHVQNFMLDPDAGVSPVTTTVTNVAGTVEARMTFLVPPRFVGARHGAVAAHLAGSAQSRLTTMAMNAPAANVITPGFVTVVDNIRPADNDTANRFAIMQNPADPDFARVVLIASNTATADVFLRTDGANQMQAALNMGGNNLTNANELQGQRAVLAQDVQAQRAVLSDGVQAQRLTLSPSGAATLRAACAPNGEMRAAADGTALICQAGTWTRAGVQPVAGSGLPCNQPGALGELVSDGTGMICQAGAWIPLQARLGALMNIASFRVGHGTVVPQPNCGPVGAVPRIFVYPRQWFDAQPNVTSVSGGISITPSGAPWRFGATIGPGANWTINIASEAGGDEAIAMTACAFL